MTIIVASSSSARVIYDMGVFLEECKGEESKVQFVFQGAGLLWGDYELARPFTESVSTALTEKLTPV